MRYARTQILLRGWILLCLVMLLASCASNPAPLLNHCAGVPGTLTVETPVPGFNGTTNKDLAYYAIDLREALQSCNADKLTIEEMYGAE